MVQTILYCTATTLTCLDQAITKHTGVTCFGKTTPERRFKTTSKNASVRTPNYVTEFIGLYWYLSEQTSFGLIKSSRTILTLMSLGKVYPHQRYIWSLSIYARPYNKDPTGRYRALSWSYLVISPIPSESERRRTEMTVGDATCRPRPYPWTIKFASKISWIIPIIKFTALCTVS